MKRSSITNSAVVVWFMSLIVVGTVVVYFLFLPKVAPKQITLAVMPFDTVTRVEPFLLHSLADEIAEGLRYSRDLTIVDFDSAVEVARLGSSMRGFTAELGASHVLVGSIERIDPDNLEITSKLVNVSQPAMKEVWAKTYTVTKGNVLPVTNQIVGAVREALYDRGSDGSPHGPHVDKEAYLSYLRARHAFHLADISQARKWLADSLSTQPNARALALQARLSVLSERTALLEQALELNSAYLPARSSLLRTDFEERGDVEEYHKQLVTLVRRYPNSVAVLWLAELYEAFGFYQGAVKLRYRVVRSRPRDCCVAATLALSRFRSGEIKDLEPLLELAGMRGEQNACALRLLHLYRLEQGSTEPVSSGDPLVNAVSAVLEEDWDVFEELVSRVSDIDGRILAYLYGGRIDSFFELLPQSRRWWSAPPLWWKKTDPRWTNITADTRYATYLTDVGLEPGVRNRVPPIDPGNLLAPGKMNEP